MIQIEVEIILVIESVWLYRAYSIYYTPYYNILHYTANT